MRFHDRYRKTISPIARRAVRRCSILLVALVAAHPSLPAHAQVEVDAGAWTAAPVASSMLGEPVRRTFTEPSIELTFDYKVDDAAVCVVWPEKSCEGLDTQALTQLFRASPMVRSAALLLYGDGQTGMITVTHTPSTRNYVSETEIDDLLRGFLIGMKSTGHSQLTMSGSAPGSRYDEIEINGVDVLRFEVQSDAPRSSPYYMRSRAVGYVFCGKYGQVMIAAGTDPQHLTQLRAEMAAMAKTVRMPPLARKGFGKTWTRLLENDIVALTLIMFIVWAISGVFYLSRRKRLQRAQQR